MIPVSAEEWYWSSCEMLWAVTSTILVKLAPFLGFKNAFIFYVLNNMYVCISIYIYIYMYSFVYCSLFCSFWHDRHAGWIYPGYRESQEWFHSGFLVVQILSTRMYISIRRTRTNADMNEWLEAPCSEEKLLQRRRRVGIWAFGAPRQGMESRVCCWIAGQQRLG